MGSISPAFEQKLGTINFVENAQKSDSILPLIGTPKIEAWDSLCGTCGILGRISLP